MNGTEGQERRHSERSIVGCGVDELGEGLDGAKTSAARVRTNEHFRHSHAPLLVSRRPGTMFTSVCKFHAHCTSFHDIGRMRQQRSAYSAQDARETRSSTFGSSVALSQAVYRGPMSSLWVEIKESKKRWPKDPAHHCQFAGPYICPGVVTISTIHHVLQLPPAYNVVVSSRSTFVLSFHPHSSLL